MNIKAAIAELAGAFTLSFVGAGSIIVDSYTGGEIGLIGIALAHGLAVAVAVSSTINISGGQINPAITIGLVIIGKEKVPQALANIFSQLLGALIAGILLKGLFPAEAAAAVKLGTPVLGEGVTQGKGILLEVIATLLLAMAAYGTIVGKQAPKRIAGLGVGMTVTFLILAIGPLTGACMNPCRHFGTAIMSGYLDNIWVFWAGPIIGSVLGFLIFVRVLEKNQT
ncbi:MAG: Aquaporin Z [Candidatus Moanabacter tarae]|uniref:Aquaporin Z n=1 Tax=Candidatus Moanibacter tarae TaxID=2200854 RepID=A0A2Z4AJH9_9BACT|nr:MAG: Aquaporin Z [Candidatus Moanabacter tarae]|tara:strand:+ start:3968 stop:4642 length:675 start_codon:yes stop_codon:yes gene_type:complete